MYIHFGNMCTVNSGPDLKSMDLDSVFDLGRVQLASD